MAFQKGQSGNPAGRPPKVVEDAKQSVLLTLFDEKAEAAVIKAQIAKAKEGDTPAATWLWDRKYGKVKEQVEHSGGTTIRVVYVDDAATD
jgi:CxxC motif-containing protein (DUF1111 family)